MVIVRRRQFQILQVHRLGIGWKLGLLFSLVGLITVVLSTVYYFIIRYDIDLQYCVGKMHNHEVNCPNSQVE